MKIYRKIIDKLKQKKFYKECYPIIKQINLIEKNYHNLDLISIKNKTIDFKKRIKSGESLDNLLPEAFALVKNASRRLMGKYFYVCNQMQKWNMIHYDVQLMGGIALHKGYIAEMRTGEGKTLVATLPLYLNALIDKNCRIATVNDFLAKRDAEWMTPLFNLINISVGYIQNNMSLKSRQAAYSCNITYGTYSEFGFDYLRDHSLAKNKNEITQTSNPNFCIIDEIDSILIDSARVPLVISVPYQNKNKISLRKIKQIVNDLIFKQHKICNDLLYNLKFINKNDEKYLINILTIKLGMPSHPTLISIINKIQKIFYKFETDINSDINKEKFLKIKEDLYFIINEKTFEIYLTDKGIKFLDKYNLKELELIDNMDEINKMLKAILLYKKDVDYVIENSKIIIIDNNTGRKMPDHRWGDGLHQAIEEKENIALSDYMINHASISIQNYFKLYDKLSGMTATANANKEEFLKIYGLKVIRIPSYKICLCKYLDDEIFKTKEQKYEAVIKKIKNLFIEKQPILVGTASIKESEILSNKLNLYNIPHKVLNAKNHQKESEIIAFAGQQGSITIATNMAGRGTDIKLGSGVANKGGLFILGTERSFSRRIDLQLSGRTARQGDPGIVKFYVSLEDDLFRLNSDNNNIYKMIKYILKNEKSISHTLINKSISSIQQKIEENNYIIRKNLLSYDNILNKHRLIIYNIRNKIIYKQNYENILYYIIRKCIPLILKNKKNDQILIQKNIQKLFNLLNIDNNNINININHIIELIINHIKNNIKGLNIKMIIDLIIVSIDMCWQRHLDNIEELKNIVYCQIYINKDPLIEYKKQSFNYFENLLDQINKEIFIKLINFLSFNSNI